MLLFDTDELFPDDDFTLGPRVRNGLSTLLGLPRGLFITTPSLRVC